MCEFLLAVVVVFLDGIDGLRGCKGQQGQGLVLIMLNAPVEDGRWITRNDIADAFTKLFEKSEREAAFLDNPIPVKTVTTGSLVLIPSRANGHQLLHKLRAAGFARRVTSACILRADAGRAMVTSPFSICATALAFAGPVATIRMEVASSIVPIPMVIAWLGEESGEAKSILLASIVEGDSLTVRVRLSCGDPGSLKPIWPFRPKPNSCRSIGPTFFRRLS